MALMDVLMNRPDPMQKLLGVQSLVDMLSGTGAGGSTAVGSLPGPGPTGGNSDWEQRARQYFMNRLGYSPDDWQKVDAIIEQESGWNPNAVNESSGAAGIAQNINGYGPGYSQENPMSQIRWLGNYLNSHNYSGYGTGIDAAYQHKQDTGWY